MQDQRSYLKVKIKSLAEEARIIRKEERKAAENTNDYGYNEELSGLHGHRVGPVRRESRHALLAYGFLRNTPYRRMESKAHTVPDWARVQKLVEKYGAQVPTLYSWTKEHGLRSQYRKKLKEEELKRFEEWRSEK